MVSLRVSSTTSHGVPSAKRIACRGLRVCRGLGGCRRAGNLCRGSGRLLMGDGRAALCYLTLQIRVVAPITVQFAGHCKPVHQLNSNSTHASPSVISSDFVECTRSIREHKHFITSLNSRKSRECHTDFSDHTSDDQLLAASAADRLSKFLIIPSIEVNRSGNTGGIREKLLQPGQQGTIRPFSKLVVRIVGRLKNCTLAPRASPLFVNSPGEQS
jgi:hypothetical protein